VVSLVLAHRQTCPEAVFLKNLGLGRDKKTPSGASRSSQRNREMYRFSNGPGQTGMSLSGILTLNNAAPREIERKALLIDRVKRKRKGP